MKNLHLTKVYINLLNLEHNMKLLQNLAPNSILFPAIKANAYGHDAFIVGKHLTKIGYKTLLVAHISEAIELIEKGLKAKFITLSPTLSRNSRYFVEYDVEPVVCTKEQIKSLNEEARKKNKIQNIHLKIDTGMGRVGINPESIWDFLNLIYNLKNINLVSIMSHFPKADEEDKSFSLKQIEIFKKIRSEISKKYPVKYFHIANSAAIFDLPSAHFEIVRPGISIYGLPPSNKIINKKVKELKPVLQWETSITYIKEVPPNTGISYGHTYYTKKKTLIATLPIGYGDGLMRILSNKMRVIINGKYCKQIGRICMDQTMVDVTPLKNNVKIGDKVIIIGSQNNLQITADELAKLANTINYEITTNISERVPRIPIY